MAKDVADNGIDAILANVIAADLLPPKAKAGAEHLVERFNTPTQVALLGHPLTGKSCVFNLLANANILSPDADLGTIKLRFGEQEKTEFTFADGSTEGRDGLPGAGPDSGREPVLTQIEAPLPALRKISLLQIGKAANEQAMQKALLWAADQADIPIWCTKDFTEAESLLWAVLPEEANDHAILLRTNWQHDVQPRADLEASLRADAGPYFAHHVVLSADEAQAARAGHEVDKDRLRASGATKLISTVLKDLERGRQSLIDSAELLLAQHGIDPDSVPIADTVGLGAVLDDTKDPTPAAQADPVDQKTGEPEEGDVVVLFRTAAERLQAVGRDMTTQGAEPDPEAVLEASADTLIWLDDYLGSSNIQGNAALDDMRALAQGATDVVQLLRLEGDESSSIDAAVLLLQLRRSLLSQVAA